MASSFIRYNDYGFWVNDSMMEITLGYLLKEIDDYENSSWINELKEIFTDNSLGYFHGYMNLKLDDLLSSDDKKNCLLKWLKLAKEKIQTKEEEISIFELNSFIVDEELQSRWIKPIKSIRIINVINHLIYLLEGSLKTRSKDSMVIE